MKKRSYLKINTIKELCLQLNLKEDLLLNTVGNIKSYYKIKPGLDKKGKLRDFYKVKRNSNLSVIHKKINGLLNKIEFPVNMQGGVKGRSIVTNASIHSRRKYVANFDIKNFFPSISSRTVYRMFIEQKCTPNVSRILTRLCTADGCLPQGFAPSPKISGLVLYHVSHRLDNLFKKFGLKHSFWIDDLTVSGNHKIKGFVKLLYKIFKQEGFPLHDDPAKVRISNSYEKHKCTKLVINQEVNVEKSLRRKIRRELYLCKKFGVENYLKENDVLDNKINYLKSLQGRIGFLCEVNSKNRIFLDQFNKIQT